jgi:hypothetical protein
LQFYVDLILFIVNRPEFFDDYEFEDEETLHHIPDVVEHLTATTLFRSYLEGSAAELGGRMSSMDSATRNAEEMIKKLTITFNRKRQAAITTELTEVCYLKNLWRLEILSQYCRRLLKEPSTLLPQNLQYNLILDVL